MEVKGDFMAASVLKKVVCCLFCVVLLFLWIAFTCTGWGVNDETNSGTPGDRIGLWRKCSASTSDVSCVSLDGYAVDWFGFTQATAIFSFLGINIAAMLVGLALFSARWKEKAKIFDFVASTLCVITGAFFLIGIIVFGAEFQDNFISPSSSNYRFGYAFGLAIVGCIGQIVIGVLLLVDDKMAAKQNEKTAPSGQ